jgi:hypothetical protein
MLGGQNLPMAGGAPRSPESQFCRHLLAPAAHVKWKVLSHLLASSFPPIRGFSQNIFQQLPLTHLRTAKHLVSFSNATPDQPQIFIHFIEMSQIVFELSQNSFVPVSTPSLSSPSIADPIRAAVSTNGR